MQILTYSKKHSPTEAMPLMKDSSVFSLVGMAVINPNPLSSFASTSRSRALTADINHIILGGHRRPFFFSVEKVIFKIKNVTCKIGEVRGARLTHGKEPTSNILKTGDPTNSQDLLD